MGNRENIVACQDCLRPYQKSIATLGAENERLSRALKHMVSRAKDTGLNYKFDAPCPLCEYNGPGYFQRGTHAKWCDALRGR